MFHETFCPPDVVCRPTFWNIPVWLQIAIYVGGLIAVLLFAYGAFRHLKLWRVGKGDFNFQAITAHLATRTRNFFTFGVLTKKVVSENQPAGIMHANLMWGMLILFMGTVLATLDWEVWRLIFHIRLLQGTFYFTYKFILDIAGLLALIALCVALYIRYVKKPRRLWGYEDGKLHFDDDLFVTGSFFVLVVTGFLLESLRIAARANIDWWAYVSIVGNTLSYIWRPLPVATIESLHLGMWVFHGGLTLILIAYVPFSKWFHVFASSTNTFFKKPAPNAIAPILNIEEQETFGVGKFQEFSWKQVMDFDACTRCGRCQAVCPASNTNKALSPKMIEVKLQDYSKQYLVPVLPFWKSVPADGGAAEPMAIHGEIISAQELWDCTTCMACVQACPVGIDQLSTIIDLRRYLTLTEGAPQSPSDKTMNSMERQGNPYGLPKAARWDSIKELGVEFAEPGVEYDVLYWVGCAGAYDARNQKVVRAMVKIMRAANLKFAVMRAERCNCESARRLGNEYLYQTATAENVENLSALKFKRIMTQCPHCFNTIKNEYPQFEGNYDVIHHTQLIAELIGNRVINPKQNITDTLTYHDSCYLGRYNNIFEPQREILQSLVSSPQTNLVEMARSRENGLCCGGGGGRMWLEENTGSRINNLRMQDVIDVQAKTVASACPFCMTMLEDGAKAKGVDEQIARQDIAELVADAL
ncbi:MAG: 4Fe-4S dicluster domain-containing protein [Chloroflexota bacterium]|nr:MAG: 4Fe-4S dicluster domain-containing protein [Chloroflexota bacterium]